MTMTVTDATTTDPATTNTKITMAVGARRRKRRYLVNFLSRVAGRLCALAGVLVFSTATAAAQDVATLRLSLDEARAREAVAQGALELRQTAERPIVALSGGYTRTNNVTEFIVPSPTGAPRVLYPDVPDNYRTRLDLQWPIYTGGRADALERAARADALAAAADVEAAQADLRLEVARAFWALVTARATVAVVDQAVVRAQGHLREARERFAAGLVPPNEVASVEAQESRQRNAADRSPQPARHVVGGPGAPHRRRCAAALRSRRRARGSRGCGVGVGQAGDGGPRAARRAPGAGAADRGRRRAARGRARRPAVSITGCSAPGFLDSGLKVSTSTLPRPVRRNRVALGLDSDSRTSPAATARCMSVETRARRGGVPRSFRSSAPTRDSPLPCG